MNHREFVCRAAIAWLTRGEANEADKVWRYAETLWEARPQWMKDQDKYGDASWKGRRFADMTIEERDVADIEADRYFAAMVDSGSVLRCNGRKWTSGDRSGDAP